MDKLKNDIAWNRLFKDYQILEKIIKEGIYKITSTTINKYREARLMTKFDHKSQLPCIFSENNLSILPVSRGGYVIAPFETFLQLQEEEAEIERIELPAFLQSLDYRDITSEATAINCLFVAKILHHFTKESNLFPTVNGRMSSSSFGFSINTLNGQIHLEVENAQVEIDGGYEGDDSLILIEAKNYISNDFLIRQLYYPYKLWQAKISKKCGQFFWHILMVYFICVNMNSTTLITITQSDSLKSRNILFKREVLIEIF